MTAAPARLADAVPDRAAARKSVPLRKLREGLILTFLILCGLFTVAVTATILLILVKETVAFFQPGLTDDQGNTVDIDVTDFLFGLQWNPLLGAERHFGVLPLITGTLQITAVAMLLAVPVGLITAIWLSEYAAPKVRSVIKPILEVLAGIPTVVFGVFAVTMVTPILQLDLRALYTGLPSGDAWNPLGIGSYNVLAAGITVGIMCIPIVTSLSEDALRAVPRALREGAYGLGSTRFEVATKVVLPAGLSGIVAAVLLAIARAVGETMIVALAAGSVPPPLHTVLAPSVPVEMVQAGAMDHQPDAPTLGQAGLMRHGAEPTDTGGVRLNDGSYELPDLRLHDVEQLDRVNVWLDGEVPPGAVRMTVLNAQGNVLGETTNGYNPKARPGPDKLSARTTPRTDAGELELRHLASAAEPFRLRIEAARGDGEPAVLRAVDVSGLAYRPLGERLATPVDVTRPTQPMTGYMVQIFLGDVSQYSVEYQSVYAVGFTLFALTFIITLIGGVIRKRYRQAYD